MASLRHRLSVTITDIENGRNPTIQIARKTCGAQALTTAVLAFQSLGAIYGDISTSPLYVYASIFPSSVPTEEEILAATSCIFWGFTLVVMIKYCLFVLILGPNNGEGGQVALYAKLARTLHLGPRGVILPGESEPDATLMLSKSMTHDSQLSRARTQLSGFLYEKFLPRLLMFLCFFGCSLVISDGLLTPTTSVLSAVDGVAVAAPSLSGAPVVGISCGILVVLFLSQRLGSARISSVFAPIVLIYLLAIAVIGIINITKYPGISKAVSPKLAIDFLRMHHGVDVLGGIMLSMTGVEAMFADVGHFGRAAVQITLSCIVYPCLMLAYFGQAAYIVLHPEQVGNAFYYSIPGGVNSPLYWVMFVLATLATIIASQALIIGVFSILRQMIHIDCFPSFKVMHTSTTVFGQVYIPAVNYMLMIGVILATVGFQTSSAVTAAYGFGISMDFIVTTILITLCMIFVYNWKWYKWLPFFTIFGALDACFIVAGLLKIPHGAWFPLVMTVLFTSFISFWRWARSLKVDEEYRRRGRITDVFAGVKTKRPPFSQQFTLGQRTVISKDAEAIEDTIAAITDDNDITAVKMADLSMRPSSVMPPCFSSVEGPLEGPRHREDERPPATVSTQAYGLDPAVSTGLRLKFGDGSVMPRMSNTVGIVYTNLMHTLNYPRSIPDILVRLFHLFPAAPSHVIFLGMQVVDVPYVANNNITVAAGAQGHGGPFNKVAVHEIADLPGFYRCVVRFGFMEPLHIEDALLDAILQEIMTDNITASAASASVYHIVLDERVRAKRTHPPRSMRGIWEAIRGVAIEYVFSPLDSLFDGFNVIGRYEAHRGDRGESEPGRTQEVLYVGNNVWL
ncbi:potassium transporter-domain-containing protein [Limtongia smithiae]|uniref:potassium transporter-domain-containing protein n=1 Tax=Limtongia smithiae TaxID=1125753 RepID=UPI0034CE6B44